MSRLNHNAHPGFDSALMRAYRQAKRVRPPRITEDDPRWNPATMGNRTGHKGQNYYVNGRLVRRGPKAV